MAIGTREPINPGVATLTAEPEAIAPAPGSPVRTSTRKLLFWFSLAWLVTIVFLAIIAQWLPMPDYRSSTGLYFNKPHFGFPEPLGTSQVGYSMTSQIIYGARESFIIGGGSVLIGMVVGGLIGLMAGYFRGRFEWFVNFLTDSLLAFPPLVLLLAVSAALAKDSGSGTSVQTLVFVLALLTVPQFLRLTRANTLVFAQREFVTAAKVQGAKTSRILFREILPNTVLPMISYAFLYVAVVIVVEGSLSFLGAGVAPPQPSWGGMLASGKSGLSTHNEYLVFVPGAFLFLTVFSLNIVGDRARRRFDVRQSMLG